MRTFSSLKNRKVVTEGGRTLGRCHDLRGELTVELAAAALVLVAGALRHGHGTLQVVGRRLEALAIEVT